MQLTLELLNAKGEWEEHIVPDTISAIVFLNNQSYAGGQDLWQHGKEARTYKHVTALPLLSSSLHFALCDRATQAASTRRRPYASRMAHSANEHAAPF
jgi:Diacylglycerol kinase accessory domain